MNLPLDTQLEILKYYPKFRTLSSQYNKEINLFYDMHCNDPISKNEYMNYVKSAKIFIICDENHCFVFKKKGKDMYSVYGVSIEIENIDIDEYTVSSKIDSIKYVDLDYIYYLIQSDIKFDFMSIATILKYRSCEIIRPGYTKNYLKIKNKDYDLTSIYGVYDQLSNLLYLIMNKNLIEGNGVVPEFPHLIYDSNDELVSGNLEEYEDIIQFFYDDAIIKIKNYINQL